jgi:hypothetical protein
MSKKSDGLLPTPNARDWKDTMNSKPNRQEHLTDALRDRLLPTPDASDRRSAKSKQQGLSNIVKLLPTPNCADAYTDKLTSSQQKETSAHSVTLPQALNHPYYNPQLLPTPQERDYKNSNTTKEITPRMKRKQEQGWTTDLNDLIASYSPPDSPANLSAMPDEERERRMTVTSGLKLLQSLKQSDPNMSFLKTLLASSVWYSPARALEWQAKPLYSVIRMKKSMITQQSADESTPTSEKQGMKQFGWLYQLAPSVRPTNGCESGLLLTPTEHDWRENLDAEIEAWERAYPKRPKPTYQRLRTQIAVEGLLPSPQAMDSVHRSRESYEGIQTRHRQGRQYPPKLADMGYWMEDKGLLPTPKQRDYKGGKGTNIERQSHDLDKVVESMSQTGQKTGMKLRLEPAFALWMMGFPEDWLDLPDGE